MGQILSLSPDGPNHAMERTADRCAFTFQITSTFSSRATRAVAAPASLPRSGCGQVRRRSSWSR